MKKLLLSFFKKSSTTCITNFPIILFFSTRNKNGEVISSEIFEKWLYYVIDRIPAKMDFIFDTMTNHTLSKHYQIIIETVQIVTIQNSDYPISTDELERIISSLLVFGENTDQNIRYELNGTTYDLPI